MDVTTWQHRPKATSPISSEALGVNPPLSTIDYRLSKHLYRSTLSLKPSHRLWSSTPSSTPPHPGVRVPLLRGYRHAGSCGPIGPGSGARLQYSDCNSFGKGRAPSGVEDLCLACFTEFKLQKTPHPHKRVPPRRVDLFACLTLVFKTHALVGEASASLCVAPV